MSYSKPKKCTYPNCFDCIYVDCKWGGVESDEIKKQNKINLRNTNQFDDHRETRRKVSQRRYERSEKGKARQREYEQSDKAKNRKIRYEQSDKARERADLYKQTEKYKQKEKRKTSKRVASGKNAEKCRRYYYRRKAREKDVS